jgi:nitrogen fixation protein FixH
LNLLITLPVGILLVIIMFFLLQRFVTRTPLRTGFSAAVLTSVLYVGYTIPFWPGGDVFAVHIALFLITIYILSITGHQRMKSGVVSRRLHWAPATIIGFFVVVVSVDSVFIYLAQRGVGPGWAQRILPTPGSGGQVESHFPGVISHDFQQKEALFNAYQAERAQQRALGWESHIGWDHTATSDRRNRLLLSLHDKDKQAIVDAEVSGRFMFPGDLKLDRKFQMHSLGGGMYAADLQLERAGTWDLVLTILRKADKLELRTTTNVGHPQAAHD